MKHAASLKQPLRFFHRNLVFGESLTDAWAVYRLETSSYDGLSTAEKKELLGLIAGFCYSIEADFSLLRVSRSWSVPEYLQAAGALLDPRHGHPLELQRYLENHDQALTHRETWRPEVYLSVRLAPPEPPLLRQTGKLLAEAAAAVRDLGRRTGTARDPRAISRRQLRAFIAAHDKAYRRITDFLDAEPASSGDLQWLVRRMFCRGLGEPDAEPNFEPQALVFEDEDDEWRYMPLEHDVLRLFDTPLVQPTRAGGLLPEPFVVAGSDRGLSYQTVLCLGALPEAAVFPGRQAELLFAPLEALDFAVDACLAARFVPNDEAVALIRKKIVDADHTYVEESHGDHGPSSASAYRPQAARELEEYLTTGARPPLLRASISLVAAAPSRDLLEERVERLRREYGTVKLHRPASDQLPLLLSHLPAQRSAVPAYDDYLTIEQVGAMVPIATHAVGSSAGPYIGYTASGSRQPVLFDLTEPSRTSRPPTIFKGGTLGSGKTIGLQLLEYQGFLQGSAIVDIDPKGKDPVTGRRDHALPELPGVAAHVEEIELAADELWRGMVDPLRIALPELAEDLAVNFLIGVLPEPVDPDWKVEIRRAVKHVLETYAREATCLRVVDHLLHGATDAAKHAGRALEVYADTGLARLGFADPASPPPEAGHKQVTMIEIRNLARPLPGTAKSDYSEDERIGQEILRLLAAYAMRLVAQDRSRHSVLGFDEAWALLATPEGRRLIEVLNRMGRSLNVTPILATQTLEEVDDLDNLLGARFAYGMQSDRDAGKALDLLGLDGQDERLRTQLTGYRRGRCLLRDYAGRVAAVQIDLVDPELLRILDTTPTAEPRKEEGADARGGVSA